MMFVIVVVQYNNNMLGNLLKTLKSQKSSNKPPIKLNPQHSSTNNYNKAQQQVHNLQIPALDLSTIDAHSLMAPSIQKITYFTIPSIPSFIFNQVLACPISVFHHLPYGNRKVKQIDLRTQQFPSYLQFLKPLLQKQVPDYNHILINYYPAGIGIMAHSDGPAYSPKVLVLSLHSHCIINFQQGYKSIQATHQQAHDRIMLQPNSIHIFEQQAYTKYLHGIDNYKIDCILVKYDMGDRKFVKANVANFQVLGLVGKVQSMIWQIQGKQGKEMEVEDGVVRVVKLDNEEFSHKVEIVREERISITIRHKYQ